MEERDFSSRFTPISAIVRAPARLPRPNLHSPLHGLVEELRREFGETASRGVGSFGYYLGKLSRLGYQTCLSVWSELRQEGHGGESARRLFWWKVGQLSRRQAVAPEDTGIDRRHLGE